jgi:hypothetical protein
MVSEITKNSSNEKKKGNQTWSRKISKNDTTEEITVCEAENGFIVTHCTYGYKGTGKDKEYYNTEKKYISKENPLEDEEEDSFADHLSEILDEIAEEDGMLEVDKSKD